MKYLPLLFCLCSFLSLPTFCQSQKERPHFSLGSTLHFNYNFSDWNSGHRDRGGDDVAGRNKEINPLNGQVVYKFEETPALTGVLSGLAWK